MNMHRDSYEICADMCVLYFVLQPLLQEDIPLKAVLKTLLRQIVSVQHMEVNKEADIHLQSILDPILKKKNAQRRL